MKGKVGLKPVRSTSVAGSISSSGTLLRIRFPRQLLHIPIGLHLQLMTAFTPTSHLVHKLVVSIAEY